MGVKVRGVSKVSNNINRLIDNIEKRKTMRALYSALFEIGLESAVLVPIDTSTLVNSQFREVVIKGTRLTGRIGYSAIYAAYVHEAKGIHLGKNTPRPVRKGEAPGSRGNIWDTSGEPKFLEKGAENARDRVDAVIRREMEL